MGKTWIKAGMALALCALALNAALTGLLVLRLTKIDREISAMARAVPCGYRDAPCYVVVRDAPSPSPASFFWGSPQRDSAEAVAAARAEQERQAAEARARIEGTGFGRAPD